MGIETQANIINPLIHDTANHVRVTSASLVPLILMSGVHSNKVMECLANFCYSSNNLAEIIERLEIKKDNEVFDATYAISDYATHYLLNLTQFLDMWRSYLKAVEDLFTIPETSKHDPKIVKIPTETNTTKNDNT